MTPADRWVTSGQELWYLELPEGVISIFAVHWARLKESMALDTEVVSLLLGKMGLPKQRQWGKAKTEEKKSTKNIRR